MSNSKKHVLVTPLDWGLGHASRSVPIIKTFLKEGAKVSVACAGNQIPFFKSQFNSLVQLFECPSYNIKYSRNIPLWLKVILQWNQIQKTIREENRWLAEKQREEGFEFIVSDNRFGMHHPNCKNIYITHQLNIKTPFNSIFANRWHRNIMRKFSEVWIPDEEGKHSLSGNLSQPIPKLQNKVVFVGHLSALQKHSPVEKKRYVLVLLSGPEPLRTELEKKLLKICGGLNNYSFVFVSGKIDATQTENINSNIHYYNWIAGEALSRLIAEASVVISRSGYSTVMDLAILGGSPFFIPTPGQTEQEYLAEYLSERYKIPFMKEKELSAEKIRLGIEEAKSNRLEVPMTDHLSEQVKRLLK